MLNRDSRSQGKEVKTEWKSSTKGQRTITVGGHVAFTQHVHDLSDQFHAPYEHLVLMK